LIFDWIWGSSQEDLEFSDLKHVGMMLLLIIKSEKSSCRKGRKDFSGLTGWKQKLFSSLLVCPINLMNDAAKHTCLGLCQNNFRNSSHCPGSHGAKSQPPTYIMQTESVTTAAALCPPDASGKNL
jgi:hypothetical protein